MRFQIDFSELSPVSTTRTLVPLTRFNQSGQSWPLLKIYLNTNTDMTMISAKQTFSWLKLPLLLGVTIIFLTGLDSPYADREFIKIKQAKVRMDITVLRSALEYYKSDNDTYPTTKQGLDALIHKPDISPIPSNWHQYLPRLPKDPWGKPYRYVSPGSHGKVDIVSLGKDSKKGGKGENSDIGNWEIQVN